MSFFFVCFCIEAIVAKLLLYNFRLHIIILLMMHLVLVLFFGPGLVAKWLIVSLIED